MDRVARPPESSKHIEYFLFPALFWRGNSLTKAGTGISADINCRRSANEIHCIPSSRRQVACVSSLWSLCIWTFCSWRWWISGYFLQFICFWCRFRLNATIILAHNYAKIHYNRTHQFVLLLNIRLCWSDVIDTTFDQCFITWTDRRNVMVACILVPGRKVLEREFFPSTVEHVSIELIFRYLIVFQTEVDNSMSTTAGGHRFYYENAIKPYFGSPDGKKPLSLNFSQDDWSKNRRLLFLFCPLNNIAWNQASRFFSCVRFGYLFFSTIWKQWHAEFGNKKINAIY